MLDIQDVKGAPVVGETYVVPCVVAQVGERPARAVPIWGELHSDAELGVPQKHFHVDHRFLNDEEFNFWFPKGHGLATDSMIYATFLKEDQLLSTPFSEVRVCQREQLPWMKASDHANALKFLTALDNLCIGKRISDKICHHRGYNMAQVPEIDGCITCPLHGAKWKVATGEYVPSGFPRELVE